MVSSFHDAHDHEHKNGSESDQFKNLEHKFDCFLFHVDRLKFVCYHISDTGRNSVTVPPVVYRSFSLVI